MARVSILIPCHNAERWMRECIESALSQTHADCEVIVVDDGSTDNSLDVIRSFGDQIRFESGPNRGGNLARNRLLELATGEWLQYLDADDFLLPEKIARQLAAATSETDAVYSRVLIQTHLDEDSTESCESDLAVDGGVLEQWIRWQLAQTGAVLWRKDALVRIGGWNEQYQCCQDNELTMRAIQHGLNLQYCNEVDAVYRIWSEETVCRRSPRRLIDVRTHLLDSMLEWLADEERMTEQFHNAAAQMFLSQREHLRNMI